MKNEKSNLVRSALVFPLLLASYEIATYLSNDAYLPALPYIAASLHTSANFVQLTLTIWFLGAALMQLVTGPITDRLGRRPVLLIGGLVFIVVTLGCALSHNIYMLLVCRFIQGAMIATMYIPGYATIHELFEQKQAIHILAIMSSITILAPALGPLLGAGVLYFVSWHWIFGILAIWAAIAIIGLFFAMPETKSSIDEKIQFKTILKQYKNIITNKKFMLLGLTGQCFFAAMIAWIAAGPFLLINRFHLSTLDFGLIQAVVFICFIIATRFIKQLMKTLELQSIIKIGMIFFVIGGIYALCTALGWPTLLLNIVIAMMLIGAGSGFAFPILSRLAIESSSEPMGSRVAVSSFLMGLSSTLATVLVSRVYNGTLFSLAIILFILSIIPLALSYRIKFLV